MQETQELVGIPPKSSRTNQSNFVHESTGQSVRDNPNGNTMSHWVHCNKCYKQPTSGRTPVKYNLTNCGHIICDRCTEMTKQACSSRDLPLTCCVCSKRRIALAAINSSMSAALKLRFTDATKLWQLEMQKLARVTAHQSQQASFLRKVICKQRATLVKADKYCKTLRAQCAQLRKDAETHEIGKRFYQNKLETSTEALKQENAALKQRIAELEAECRATRGARSLTRRTPFGDRLDVSASRTSSGIFGFDESGAGNDQEMASIDDLYAPFGASSSAEHNISRRSIPPEPSRSAMGDFPTPSSSAHSRDTSYVSATRTPTSLTALKPELMASYSSKRPASSIGGRSGGGSSGYIPKNRPLTLRF